MPKYVNIIEDKDLTNTIEEALFLLIRSIGLNYNHILWMFDKSKFYEFFSLQNLALSNYMKILRLFFVGMPDVQKEFMINYYFFKNIQKYFNAKQLSDLKDMVSDDEVEEDKDKDKEDEDEEDEDEEDKDEEDKDSEDEYEDDEDEDEDEDDEDLDEL